MQERRQADIQKYKRRHQKRKAWRNVVRILACVVVFCTTYALILPAITMEKDTFCGMEAHVHEEACYGELAAMVCEPGADLPVIHSHDALCYSGEQLICKLPEVAEHIHGESCYETVTLEAHTHGESCYAPQRGNLLCEIPEEESHAHGGDCYTPGETLLCTEAERAGHSHGAACYNTETVLTCTTAETQGHSHGEGCYDADGNLICTEAEVAAQTHGDGCYTTTQTLICTEAEDPGHTHGNDCYEQVLSCTLEEKAGHAHTDECYEMTDALTCGLEERAETVYDRVLVCTLPQVAVHTHADACYEGGVLTCQIQCATVHQHTEDCIQIHAQTEENLICELEVHEHTLACYSNPQADVESSADWEESVSKVKLTGNWRQDLVAIAKSQLGYNESTKNYIVGEDGETIYGYSRYGAWYGAPYGDWCAMYASFCIRYAGISGMPLDANCPNWIRQLAERGLYHDESDYTPEAGDLIFFDWNDDGSSDHVGIVVEVNGEKVKTIEGNSGDTVAYHTYNLSNVTIQGYGSLPRQLTEAERAAVDNVIALIDAMPSADEIDAKIAEFEELEDYEGEEAWLTEVYQQIGNTYVAYRDLGEELQMFVTNRDKLLELEYIWSVIPLPESGATIAQTVAFKTDLLTNTNRFVIYTRGTDNQYYAIDSDGEAVPVTIDAAGNLKSIASDPTALYWTFTKNNNDNNYRIRNVKSTNKYIRLNTQVVGNDQSITVSDKSDGTFTLRRDNTHQLGYSNKAFAIVNNSNNAATLYLAQAPAMVKVWFDGTCGGTENYEGAGGKLKGESEFTAMELPEKNAVLPDTWEGPHEYDYVLRGWYDIVNGVYYEAGATVENLEAGVIFYADWRARTYDVGKNEEGKVSNTVSTDHFITTRMYDYGVLFNMYSETPTITRNNNGEPTAVTWSIVEQGENAVHQKTDASGNPTGEKDTSMGFIFRDWEQSVNSRWIKLGQPTNWDQEPVAHINNYHPQDAKKVNNQTPKDGTTRGILGTDSRILDRLFTTSGGVLGQEYLGTADHLFHYVQIPATRKLTVTTTTIPSGTQHLIISPTSGSMYITIWSRQRTVMVEVVVSTQTSCPLILPMPIPRIMQNPVQALSPVEKPVICTTPRPMAKIMQACLRYLPTCGLA